MPTLLSCAKINLFLEVVGKRPDGFHDIESVFLEIDLADTLTAESGEMGETVLVCDDPGVPLGKRNLAVRAADLLRETCGIREGIRFRLEKRIPMGGGLGGGSSNAASALRLANDLWKTGLSRDELAELGGRLGSDVPFFLYGGMCLCQGRGERVTPLPPFPPGFDFGVVLPQIHSDTAAAYRGLRLPTPAERRTAAAFLEAAAAGDAVMMERTAFNRFEETVFAALPELGRLHAWLEKRLETPVRLSGSGAGLWYLGHYPSHIRTAVSGEEIVIP